MKLRSESVENGDLSGPKSEFKNLPKGEFKNLPKGEFKNQFLGRNRIEIPSGLKIYF
jgi:hypothetical protein